MNGLGRESFADGRLYEGNYKDSKKNGYGIFKWSNGNYWMGNIKDDK